MALSKLLFRKEEDNVPEPKRSYDESVKGEGAL